MGGVVKSAFGGGGVAAGKKGVKAVGNIGKGSKHALLGQDKKYKMDLQSPEQKEAFNKMLSQLNPKDFAKAYDTLLKVPKSDIKDYQKGIGKFLNTNEKAYSKPFMKGMDSFINPSTKDMMKSFQTGVVDPTMNMFNKQIMPAVQERLGGENLGFSSSMNNALASAGQDISTYIGSQLPGFLQNMQQNKLSAMGLLPGMINQGANTRLSALNMMPGSMSNFYSPMQNALSGYQGALGEQTFQPVLSQQQGILQNKEASGGLAAIISAMSSRDVKENIRDFTEGLSAIDKMEVKSYDYIDGEKNRLGIIAEDAPPEIRTKLNGVNAIDLYGMMSLMVNAIKELSGRLELLEAK